MALGATVGSLGAPASAWESTVGSHLGRVAGIHLAVVVVAVAVAAAAAAAGEAHTECTAHSHRPAAASCSADPCCQALRQSAVTGSRYRGAALRPKGGV